MRLSTELLIGSILLGTSSLAIAGEQPARSVPGPVRAGSTELSAPWDASLRNRANRFYYSLAGEPLAPGQHELQFKVLADNRLFLDDLLRLPQDAAGATFEILAGNATWRQRVAKLASTTRRAEVQILLDGRLLRTFSLPAFLDYNRGLQLVPLTLRQPVSETWSLWAQEGTSPLPNVTTKDYDPVCWNNCDSNRQYCYQTEPSCAYVDYCDVCENQFASCTNGCVVCTDPKSVSYRDQYFAGNPMWIGSECIHNYWDGGTWYDYYRFTLRKCQVKVTQYCDGHTTEQYTGFCTDSTATCGAAGWQCYYPTTWFVPPSCPYFTF